jgi:hypothetical protein
MLRRREIVCDAKLILRMAYDPELLAASDAKHPEAE